jgi:hypothetical protein
MDGQHITQPRAPQPSAEVAGALDDNRFRAAACCANRCADAREPATDNNHIRLGDDRRFARGFDDAVLRRCAGSDDADAQDKDAEYSRLGHSIHLVGFFTILSIFPQLGIDTAAARRYCLAADQFGGTR